MSDDNGQDAESNTDHYPVPESWEWTTLGDISEVASGVTKGQRHREGTVLRKVPYLRVANVQRGFLDLTEMKTIEVTDEKVEQLRLQVGDVLFNEGGDRDKLGRGWIWNGEIDDCIHQNHVFRARMSGGIDPKFIAYHANSYGIEWFWRHGKQSVNLASINQTVLRRFPIPVAPLNEQRRIVEKTDELLSDLDAGVAALERVQKALKRYRASVLKAAVEGKLTAEWRAEHADQEPASELLQRILTERRSKWEAEQLARFEAAGKKPPKDWQSKYKEPVEPDTNEASALPEGWCWATVDQTSFVVRYGSSSKTSADSAGVPVLRMGNIQDGEIDLADLKYLPNNHEEFPELLLEVGDILFNRTNSAELVGKTAVYRGNPERCSYASYLIAVKMLDGANPHYVACCLNSVFGRGWINSVVSQQVGQANVNGTKLKAFRFPLPPCEEQAQIVKEFDERLSVLDATAKQIETDLKRASRLRQSILKRAFEGKLVPQAPDDEPAEKLLERIQTEREAALEEAKKNGKPKTRRKKARRAKS